jgi:hypothetical protein
MLPADRLLDFYSGLRPDDRGRMIDDVWRMSLDQLEDTHDYIQWLFPLRERSAFNADAPLLDAATIAAFHAPDLQARLRRSSSVMARFYGFDVDDVHAKPHLRRAADFDARAKVWLTRGNHNLLRLTRIMKSLTTLGLSSLAAAWFSALSAVHAEHRSTIGETTMHYWRSARGANVADDLADE